MGAEQPFVAGTDGKVAVKVAEVYRHLPDGLGQVEHDRHAGLVGDGGCLFDGEKAAIGRADVAEADQAGAVVEHVCEVTEKVFVVDFAQHDRLDAVLSAPGSRRGRRC